MSVVEGFGTAGGETGFQRRIALPAGSACHVGGRHPASDIFLDDVPVSRRHAECRWENDELHVVDMGSLNDTYVNRGEVHIGKFRLVFVRS